MLRWRAANVQLGLLLVWSELKYVFIGFALMNLRFEVSIQRLFFDVSINHDALYR